MRFVEMLDCFTCISALSCPVDMTSLRFTCKEFHALPAPDYNLLFREELGKYVKDVDEFVEKLKQYKCVITGSFILSLLYGKAFDYDDIDLLENIDYTGQIDRMFGNIDTTQNLYHSSRIISMNPTMLSYMYETEKNYEATTHDDMTYITRMFYKKVQHICVPLDPVSYISRTFDLDICKSYWNGEKLYIKDWNKLFTRKDYIRPNTKIMAFYMQLIQRGARYCRKFHEHDETINKHDYRVAKYEARGFHIEPHPRFQEMQQFIDTLCPFAFDFYGHADDISLALKHVKEGTLDLESFDH